MRPPEGLKISEIAVMYGTGAAPAVAQVRGDEQKALDCLICHALTNTPPTEAEIEACERELQDRWDMRDYNEQEQWR